MSTIAWTYAAELMEEIMAEYPENKMTSELRSLSNQVLKNVRRADRMVQDMLDATVVQVGEATTPITISLRESHDRVMVSEHNCGNPIPAELSESLFQVFRRAEAAKKGSVKGWGIGLALSRSTAERMGGSLEVDSFQEQGTTFTIDIPNDARPFQD